MGGLQAFAVAHPRHNRGAGVAVQRIVGDFDEIDRLVHQAEVTAIAW